MKILPIISGARGSRAVFITAELAVCAVSVSGPIFVHNFLSQSCQPAFWVLQGRKLAGTTLRSHKLVDEFEEPNSQYYRGIPLNSAI